MRETPPVQVDEKKLFSLIDAAFRMRRKTLVNNLMPVYSLSRSQAEELVQKAGLPAGVRGEALSLEEFAALTNLL
ncbi:Ribosomal RNA small subunit methyltransferase A [bioreactor metagenome]|uniref:Ribosomal RNA small subunit methyltransferase A n=1 Tax=bioreactor metagenome TaxID=1076179 RepID=A0A645IU01_9ZZZZ